MWNVEYLVNGMQNKKKDYFKSEQNQCNKIFYMFEIYTFKPLLLKSYMCKWIVNCFLYSVKKMFFLLLTAVLVQLCVLVIIRQYNGDIMCMLEKKNVCMGMKIDESFQQQQ